MSMVFYGEELTDRSTIFVVGRGAERFLQKLVTNDVTKARGDALIYTALLTPKGKYLADFFITPDERSLMIDVHASLADRLMEELSVYKPRFGVTLEAFNVAVSRGTGDSPAGARPDPRHPALGWRAYGLPASKTKSDYDAIRVEHLIPETGIELIPDETCILEAGLEGLNAIDLDKRSCIGWEALAQKKQKAKLERGLAQVAVDGLAEPGTEITANDKPVGVLHTRSGNRAIAYLWFGRAVGEMRAGGANITRMLP